MCIRDRPLFISCGNKSSDNSEDIDSCFVDSTEIDSLEIANTVLSRDYLRNWINKKKEVRFCVISSSCRGTFVYGNNGFGPSKDLNEQLLDKMHEINSKRQEIIDINITDGGYWLVVFDNNRFYGEVPQEVSDKLHSIEAKESDLVFRSVDFNDNNDYIIVTAANFYTSSEEYANFYNIKRNELGDLYTATISNEGAIFCFEYGMTYCGKIPKNVAKALSNAQNVYMAKFTSQGDYIFASKDGKSYKYYIDDIIPNKECEMVENQTKKSTSQSTPKETSDGGGYYPSGHLVTKPQTCGVCGGSGLCTNCGGNGISSFGHAHVCGACGGKGRCGTCNGFGISGTVQTFEYY